MSVTLLNIYIIDTHDNNRVLIVEDTQVEAPRLVYNGQEDRFGVFFTSELQFNLLVDDKSDGKFFHLFTGSETRYRIVLEDVTYPKDIKVLWQGFLLPEQFNEPYKGGSFFVEFIATDGIGRLKNKVLAPEFYTEEKSVTEILAACLQQTGLELPLVIAPAIKNAVANIKTSEIFIDTACYLDGEKEKSTYDILEDIALVLGCKLFQCNMAWCLVGVNRFPEQELIVENYTSLGVFINKSAVFRTVKDGLFLEGVQISLNPPLQEMLVEWEKKEKNFLFPEKIGEFRMEDFTAPIPYHFTSNFLIAGGTAGSYRAGINLDFSHLVDADFFPYYSTPLVPDPNYWIRPSEFYLNIYGSVPVIDDLDDNYIQLTEEVFIEAGRVVNLEIDIKVSALDVSEADLKAFVENGDIKNAIFYNVYFTEFKNGTQTKYITNFPRVGVLSEIYGFKYSFDSNDKNAEFIEGKLKIENLEISKSGYYGFRLFPVVSNLSDVFRIRFPKLSFTTEGKDSEETVLTRNIDFTTSNSITVYHGSDEMSLTNRRFLIKPEVPVLIDISEPAQQINLPIISYTKNYDLYSNGVDYLLTVVIDPLVYASYIEGVVGEANLFRQLSGTGTIEPFQYFAVINSDGNIELYQTYISSVVISEDLILQPDELIFLNIDAVSETIDYSEYLYDKWSRVGFSENDKFLTSLNKVYHGSLDRYNFKFSADATFFVLPLDIIAFNFQEDRVFMPTTIDVNLTEGQTRVDLVELVNGNPKFNEG